MYINYKSFSVDFNCDDLTFKTFYSKVEQQNEVCFIDNGAITVTDLNGNPLTVNDFKNKDVSIINELKSIKLRIMLTGGTIATPSLELIFSADSHNLTLHAIGRAYTTFSGDIIWGNDMENSTFSCRCGNQNSVLHTACGPAVSAFDNALFDKNSDSLLTYNTAGKMRLSFDWNKKCYSFTHTNGLDHGKTLRFAVKENVIAEKYNTPYAPQEYAHQFNTPPVGWMTWYAVKFDCSHKKVLDNAEKFVSTFGKYADKTVIWVDWEWCHKCFDGQGEEGADIFHPRKTAYPDGLKVISDKIKSLGAIPALWTGATNEGVVNDLLKANPSWIIGQKAIWCGQYWVDISNPDVLEHYIKKIFRQILDWGYEVIKWDCLPVTLEMLSEFHNNLYDKKQSPHQALRSAIKAARSVIGRERYLLSCSGSSERDTTFAVDLFDAARIGGDIFTWEDYLEQAVNLVLHYYPLHNTVYYADADNLVLRSEFNSVEQARSRISFYGLAGLPITLGDEIDALDETRIDMLKRIMPTVSMHGAELEIKKRDERFQIVNSAIAKKFGQWNVVGITNFLEKPADIPINLATDLQLDTNESYAVFDFWKQEFTGIFSSCFQTKPEACGTNVFRITKLDNSPLQLIGSNRHILQGAAEICDVQFAENAYQYSVNCVENEDLILTFLVNENVREISCRNAEISRDGNICKVTVSGAGKVDFCLKYSM